MKKKNKISRFEKEWNKQFNQAKELNWDFSLPLKPVLGKNGAWTPAKKKAVHGRIVTVGWADAPACIGIAFYDKNWSSQPQILTFDGITNDIDGPEQIISVGDKFETIYKKAVNK